MLSVGDRTDFHYVIPPDKTVPDLYPESPEFQSIPAVFATGFMVGLMEWACIRHLHPTLPSDMSSVGVHIDSSHIAASLPGMGVHVTCTVTSASERRVTWKVTAHDDHELIGEGTHSRAVINPEKFMSRVMAKTSPPDC